MYCVKCRKHTETDNVQTVTIQKNSRSMLKGFVTCVEK